MSNKITQLTVGDTVKENSKEYLKYYVSDHYPSAIDGLKSVYRRVIYQLRNTTSVIPSTEAVASTLKVHIHAPDAIYDTIVRMSQPFSMFPALTIISGDGGCYSDPRGFASSRYTKSSISDFTRDIFIKGIDMSTLRFKVTEDLAGYEPSYFIPKIPTNLIYGLSNIGYGFTSRPISFRFDDVCDLTIKYLTDKEAYRERFKTLVPYIHGNSVLNFHEVYQKMQDNKYDNGEMRIKYESRIEILDDNMILIRSVSAGSSMTTIKDKLLEKMREKGSWLNTEISEFKDLSDSKNINDANVILKFKRTPNLNIIKWVENLSFLITNTHSVYNNFELQGTMLNLSVGGLLERWYTERRRSVIGDLRKKVKNFHSELRRIEAVLAIVDHIDDVIHTIRTYEDDDIRRIFRDKYKLSPVQTEYIRNTPLKVLQRSSGEKLREEQKETEIKITDLISILDDPSKINSIIVDDVSRILSKYGRKLSDDNDFVPLRTYIGLLITAQGYILVESIEELSKYKDISSSKFTPIEFIKFVKEPEYLNNDIYVSKKNSNTLVPSSELNIKFSSSATLIMSYIVNRTVVITKGNRAIVHDGLVYVNKGSSTDLSVNYMCGTIAFITNTLKIHKLDSDTIATNLAKGSGKYEFDKKVIGVFSPLVCPDETYFTILIFMNENKFTLVKYTDNLKDIKIVSKNLKYVGYMTSTDKEHIFIHDEKWYHIEIDDKMMKDFQKFSYQDVGLIKARFK